MATRSGACITAVPNQINGRNMSQEEFRDNLCLRDGLKMLNLSSDCNICEKNFTEEHALPFLNGGLVLIRHIGAAR